MGKLTLAVMMSVLVALAAAATADTTGPKLEMRMVGSEPAMVNAPDILNPRTNNGGIKVMTMNPATGLL
jgi:hypothetical protein